LHHIILADSIDGYPVTIIPDSGKA